MTRSLLSFYSKIVVGATFVLIVAGGLVTSTGSGLSVPDWPLSYGRFFPPMIGGIRFEHTHRVIAGLVGLMTFAMSFLLFKYDSRRWVQKLGLAAALAIVLQAVLGGLTVIHLLPTGISMIHACLAQTFFCLVLAIAYTTSAEWEETPCLVSNRMNFLKRTAFVTTALIYGQLLVGAIVRHAEGRWVPVHILLAFFILGHVVFLVLKTAENNSFRSHLFFHALIIGVLVIAQIFLGLAAYVFKWVLSRPETPSNAEVLLTAAHQSNGALVLAGSALFWFKTLRMGRRGP